MTRVQFVLNRVRKKEFYDTKDDVLMGFSVQDGLEVLYELEKKAIGAELLEIQAGIAELEQQLSSTALSNGFSDDDFIRVIRSLPNEPAIRTKVMSAIMQFVREPIP